MLKKNRRIKKRNISLWNGANGNEIDYRKNVYPTSEIAEHLIKSMNILEIMAIQILK